MTETKQATSIPTAQELDEWVEALERGYAVTEMMPRFIEGYRRLLVVAEKAREVDALDDGDYLRDDDECERFAGLHDALKALYAPVGKES